MEKIFYNGTFITMNETESQTGAVLVKDGVIEATGVFDVLRQKAPEAVLVDLNGKTVLPGFVDGHSHITAVASNMQLANLKPSPAGNCNSIEDLIGILKQFMEEKKAAGTLSDGDWVMGMGYDNSVFKDGRHPGTKELDQVSAVNPVAAIHVSGHICAVNTRGLELLGYSGSEIKVPAGGIVEPEGVLKENAFLVPEKQKIMMSALKQDMAVMIGQASEYYASYGITTAQDARAGEGDYLNLMKAGEKGLLKNDVVLYMPQQAAEKYLPKQEPWKNTYHNRVRIAGLKTFLDGSPQGKTAWLSKPYYQVPEGEESDYCGRPVLADEAVTETFSACIRNHWQVNVHANGDAAIEQMIRCYEAAEKQVEEQAGEQKGNQTGKQPGSEDLRPVIIHCQTARKDQMERMGRDKIRASFFDDHVYYWGDYHYESVLGPDRAENISPLSWALEYGVSFTLHQDSPVVPPNILFTVHNAVNRRTKNGRLLGADHRISVMEALKAVTVNAAAQIFEEEKKGSIAAGKMADFVVLDRNPLEVSPEKIKEICVLETIKDGETIYRAKNDCNL